MASRRGDADAVSSKFLDHHLCGTHPTALRFGASLLSPSSRRGPLHPLRCRAGERVPSPPPRHTRERRHQLGHRAPVPPSAEPMPVQKTVQRDADHAACSRQRRRVSSHGGEAAAREKIVAEAMQGVARATELAPSVGRCAPPPQPRAATQPTQRAARRSTRHARAAESKLRRRRTRRA
eukprot:396184-Pleurochrysis_carterae.AAC.1